MSAVASLDAARRLASVEGAKQVELATWDFADALVEDVPENSARRNFQRKTLQRLKLVGEQLTRAGFDYAVGTLSQDRATALAWPEETRIHQGAAFAVHRELRGVEDRTAVIAKLIRKHGGRVTRKQVREWKREQNPPAFKSWSDMMRDRIMAVVRHAETPEAKAEMAALLRAAAQELEDV